MSRRAAPAIAIAALLAAAQAHAQIGRCNSGKA